MALGWTIAGLVLSLGAVLLGVFAERRPRELGKLRRVPWNGLIYIALIAALVFARHLIGLLGAGPA